MKQNIVELNVVRAFAILAVLVIHTTADPTVYIPWVSRSAPLYLAINRLSIFAVPVFIMISGIVLFYRYLDTWKISQAVSFYLKRLKFIVIPYLVWSFFYYVYNQYLFTDSITVNPSRFLDRAMWGEHSYHLYYLVIAIQMYVVFPLIVTLVKKLHISSKGLIVFGIASQVLFKVIHHWIYHFDHTWALFPNYILVFCVGGAIGMNYSKFSEWSSHLWWIFGAALALGFANLILVIVSKSSIHYGPHVYDILFNGYAIFMGISLIWISKKIVENQQRLFRWLNFIGAYSFGIYLVHPAILSTWRYFVNPTYNEPFYHLYNLLTFSIVVIIPLLATIIIKRVKFSWLLFGRG